MQVNNILVKLVGEDKYLLIGFSENEGKKPKNWHMPIMPNEYGDLNVEKVLSNFLMDNYGMKLNKIVDKSSGSTIIYVEANLSEHFSKVILFDDEDPYDVFEHRLLVTKDELKKIIEKHPADIIGDYR